jgi:hypothetical protein
VKVEKAVNLTQGNFGVIYTHANKEDSELVILDRSGKRVDAHQFHEMGMFQIEKGKEKRLVLPVRFGDKMFYIHREGQVLWNKTHAYPLDVKEDKQIRITTFNSAYDWGTLQIELPGKTYRLKQLGFLRTTTYDDKYIYAFVDFPEAKKAKLIVVRRDNGKKQEEIPMPILHANDMKMIHGHLLISSNDNHFLLDIHTKNWKLNKINLPFAQTQYILPAQEYIYVTYRGKKKVTKLNPKTFQVVTTNEVRYPIYKAEMDQKNLYILSQLEHPSYAGVVSIYDLKTWILKKQFFLPQVREMQVQDFTVFS